MLKIGICIDSLNTGGAEKLLIDIIKILSKKYDIYLLTKYKSYSYYYKEIEDRVNYSYLLENITTEKTFFKKIKESIVKRNRFKRFAAQVDIVIDFLDGDFYKYIKNVKNITKIIWCHSNWDSLIKRKKIDKKLKYYDKIVVICDKMRQEFIEKNIAQDKLFTIYNIIDYDYIDRKLKQKTCYYPFEYFLTVCRLNEREKDVSTLLRAFSKYTGEEKLIIAGDGPDKNLLQNLTKKLNLTERVLFLGNLENPYSLMKNARAFILSSKGEGFGLVLVEALYCGTKVIASDCPVGPAEILLDGKIGELFHFGNEMDLLGKLKKITDKTYNLNEIDVSLKRYKPQIFIEKFEELLK